MFKMWVFIALVFLAFSASAQEAIMQYTVEYDCMKQTAVVEFPMPLYAAEDVVQSPPGNPVQKQVRCKSVMCKEIVAGMEKIPQLESWQFDLTSSGRFLLVLRPNQHIDRVYGTVAMLVKRSFIKAFKLPDDSVHMIMKNKVIKCDRPRIAPETSADKSGGDKTDKLVAPQSAATSASDSGAPKKLVRPREGPPTVKSTTSPVVPGPFKRLLAYDFKKDEGPRGEDVRMLLSYARRKDKKFAEVYNLNAKKWTQKDRFGPSLRSYIMSVQACSKIPQTGVFDQATRNLFNNFYKDDPASFEVFPDLLVPASEPDKKPEAKPAPVADSSKKSAVGQPTPKAAPTPEPKKAEQGNKSKKGGKPD